MGRFVGDVASLCFEEAADGAVGGLSKTGEVAISSGCADRGCSCCAVPASSRPISGMSCTGRSGGSTRLQPVVSSCSTSVGWTWPLVGKGCCTSELAINLRPGGVKLGERASKRNSSRHLAWSNQTSTLPGGPEAPNWLSGPPEDTMYVTIDTSTSFPLMF